MRGTAEVPSLCSSESAERIPRRSLAVPEVYALKSGGIMKNFCARGACSFMTEQALLCSLVVPGSTNNPVD